MKIMNFDVQNFLTAIELQLQLDELSLQLLSYYIVYMQFIFAI